MNLFCFSLEGSMDSLYEPVQNIQETTENSRNRASSPPCTYTKITSHERSLSMEQDLAESPIFNLNEQDVQMPDLDITDAKKKRKKSVIQKSVSENEAFDLREEDYMMGDRSNLLSRKKAEDNLCQISTNKQWNPPRNLSSNGCTTDMDSDDSKSESMGTLKRLQKIVRTKKGSDDVRHALLQSPAPDIDEEEEETLITCMKLTKSQEKKFSKDTARKRQEAYYSMEVNCSSLDRSVKLKRNTSRGVTTSPESHSRFLTDWKSFPDNFDPFDFAVSQMEEWDHCICCNHHGPLPSSFTDSDLPYSWEAVEMPTVGMLASEFRTSQSPGAGILTRTTSFGAFDRFKKPSVSKPEDNEIGDTESLCEGGAVAEGDKMSNNAGSLTKKMKAISLTMRKKMGKKYIKTLSESEDGDGIFSSHDTTGGVANEKVTLRASESVESLYSLNSGQSSSSGVTSCSDGTSNRDSFRFDDDMPYSGPFCGRARVHTDFTPSPYDTESLKIKKGDIIDIIYKTPMGIWTGMLNNKVGNFKFIYVDIISEEEIPPIKRIARRKSKRPRPKTLQELLERFNLQDYMSSLLLNGYETLEDLKDIKESHLCELNITNPEERMRLLVAIENLQDSDCGQESGNGSVPLTLSPESPANKCDLSDCPRDSGCYITLENTENSKDYGETEKLCDAVQQIIITESP